MSTGFDKIGTDRLLQDHWIRRLIAGAIDSIILWITTSIILYFVPLPPSAVNIPFFGDPAEWVRGILFFVYAAILESTWGTTVGKQLMYLRVTTTDGKLPNLSRTWIRDISKINGLFWLIDTLVGMATVGDPHQKYSDRFAGTTVASTISRSLILPSSSSSPPPPTLPTPETST